MPEEQKQDAAALAVSAPRRMSPNFVSLYVNQTEFAMTPWDLQIQMSNVHGEGSSLVIEDVANLSMSPHHAKAFALALLTNVKAWEQSFGEIKLPRQVLVKAVGEENVPPEGAAADKPSGE
jgi:hypothetical protein